MPKLTQDQRLARDMKESAMINTKAVVLMLPFLPPRELSPNARIHWAKRYSVAKKMKADTYMIAKAAGRTPQFTKARISFAFFVAQNRRRDGDNWLASMKACVDGLRDAGLFPDDDSAHVEFAPVAFVIDKKQAPMTRVRIEEVA